MHAKPDLRGFFSNCGYRSGSVITADYEVQSLSNGLLPVFLGFVFRLRWPCFVFLCVPVAIVASLGAAFGRSPELAAERKAQMRMQRCFDW